jgi:hypothetical protein
LSALLLMPLVPCALLPQTKPRVVTSGIDRPTSAIYIGGSFFYYNNGLQNHVGGLVTAAEPQYALRQTLVGIGGSGLSWHDVESYFRPNALGSYSIDAKSNVVFNTLGDRLFDLAIMMDCSQCPIHPQLKGVFWEFAKKHSETIRKHNAVPVLFMSWANADRPQMITDLAEEYTRVGNDNNALVIPAGLAFAKSVKLRPNVNLYFTDGRHPSLLGTYLAACTVYASLFRRSPVGLSYTAGIDLETAHYLQTVAWETVQEYFRP